VVERLAAAKSIPNDAASAGKRLPAEPETSTAPAELQTVIAQVKSQLEANRLEMDSLTETEGKLKADIAKYQARLNLTPVREQQLTSMLRDYELSKQNYADLLGKQMQSQMATNLEKRQEGQQFRLADPPNLPTVPSSPKRLKFSLAGLAGGLGIGLALAFLGEIRRPTYHSETDAQLHLGLPFVIGMPLTPTSQEIRNQRWKHGLEWCLSSTLILAVLAVQFYVYRHG
jgi:hypothetical protein